MSELSFADTLSVLEKIESADDRRVLIGGQALNLWCHEYSAAVAHLEGGGVLTSKDVDFQGDTADAQWCARRLNGQCLVDAKSATPPCDIVLFNDPQGVEQRIDFLPAVYGLEPDRVLQASIRVPFAKTLGGELKIRVMNPVHCLMSRVHNVMGLPDKYLNPHGLRQLEASVICAREYIAKLAAEADDDGKCKLARDASERVFKFAVNEHQAQRLYLARDIEVFDAVVSLDCFPEMFRERRYPQMLHEMSKRRRRISIRGARRALSTGSWPPSTVLPGRRW